jgi:signal transduction histidine kinase
VRQWLAQGKDVTLLGATAPVWVEGSPEMLGRAILNLAENAINRTAAESTVEFMVEDFQRFWRRGHRKAGSTGLGLSRIGPRASGSVTSRSKAG